MRLTIAVTAATTALLAQPGIANEAVEQTIRAAMQATLAPITADASTQAAEIANDIGGRATATLVVNRWFAPCRTTIELLVRQGEQSARL